MLVNLPPSHVGCQGEELMTTFFTGGTAVILSRFDAEKSLQAIERYKVESMGQIPSMFQMQWQLPNFARIRLKLAAERDVWRATGDAAVRRTPVCHGAGGRHGAGNDRDGRFRHLYRPHERRRLLGQRRGLADADHAAFDPPAR